MFALGHICKGDLFQLQKRPQEIFVSSFNVIV